MLLLADEAGTRGTKRLGSWMDNSHEVRRLESPERRRCGFGIESDHRKRHHFEALGVDVEGWNSDERD